MRRHAFVAAITGGLALVASPSSSPAQQETRQVAQLWEPSCAPPRRISPMQGCAPFVRLLDFASVFLPPSSDRRE